MELITTCEPVWVTVSDAQGARFKVKPLVLPASTKLINAFSVDGADRSLLKADPDAVLEALHASLLDWDGIFEKGKAVPFQTRTIQFLPPSVATQLAFEIVRISVLRDDEAGNSDSQSTSGSA